MTSWSDPGTEEVAAGVWRIPVVLPLDGLRAVNVYAVADGPGLTVIDAGWAMTECRTALVRGLAEIGAGLGDIRRFLVTHAHRDHYPAAVVVRREFGTQILVGSGERAAVDVLSRPDPPDMADQFRRLTRLGAPDLAARLSQLWAARGSDDMGYELPDRWIRDGEQFTVGDRVLRAVETPGHTRGHLVFVDEAGGLLFAGDHVLPQITPSVAFELDPPPLALRDYLRSLELVRAMPEMTLLPAHGPAGDKVHARVDQLLAHHDIRLTASAAAISGAGSTALDVAAELGWTSRHRAYAELDPYNQMLAVFETALHLNLLVAQGRAALDEVDGVDLFRRPDRPT